VRLHPLDLLAEAGVVEVRGTVDQVRLTHGRLRCGRGVGDRHAVLPVVVDTFDAELAEEELGGAERCREEVRDVEDRRDARRVGVRDRRQDVVGLAQLSHALPVALPVGDLQHVEVAGRDAEAEEEAQES
jgi:hypothetical protein